MSSTTRDLRTSTRPADHDQREAVRHRLDETLFVDAGAGTGKTTALVGRIVALVQEAGVDLRSIAAITFTEAAAAELRHRVREALERAAVDEDPTGSTPAGDALRVIDEAAFTTLHAFAQRIIADHPVAAGLPPEIGVVDEVEERIEFDRRWRVFLDELVEDPELTPVLRRAIRFGFGVARLRDLAASLHGDHDRIPADVGRPDLPAVETSRLVAALRRAYDLRHGCPARGDKLREHLEETVGPLLDGLARAEGDDADQLAALASVDGRLDANRGRKDDWRDKEAVLAALRDAQAELDRILREQRETIVATFLARVGGFVTGWFEDRKREGRLTFHDLLVIARDLLRLPDVRRSVGERWERLLIDEFQDTDPLQIELSVSIAASVGDLDGRAWHEVPTGPGRLFFVGDPKQSIYRFRRADITLYERAKRELDPELVELTANFRCAPGVIDFVNAAFAELIGEGQTDAQPAYTPLVAHRDDRPAGPAVTWFGSALDDRVGAAREAEAEDVPRVVQRVMADGWQVSDRASSSHRGARLRDIAILVRRHATVRLLERSLDRAGIPYRIESRSLVFATEEVRDLLTILRAVDDPADEVAVVAALRHPAFGCSDRDLLEWRDSGGSWSPTRERPAGVAEDQPVARGMERLERLHHRRWEFTCGGMVEHVIDDLRLLELAAAHPRPRDRWRRLRFVAERAHEHHAAGGDLGGFLAWAADQAEENIRVDEVIVEEPDDDAVRILTVHGSKGLEFPIVVCLGLDGDLRKLPVYPRVLWDDGERPQISLGNDFESDGYRAHYGREKDMNRHEERRLLYVATTRARDHLVLSLHHKTGTECHAAHLLASGTVAERWQELDLQVEGAGAAASSGGAEPEHDLPARRDAWEALRAEQVVAAGRPRVYAATTLARELAAPDPQFPAVHGEDEDETPPWKRGRAGTSVGRAVHAVLQAVDLHEGTGLDALARAQAAAEGVPHAAEDVARLARTALRSRTVQAAVRSGRFWRELHVGAPVAGLTVEGFIDLLYEDDDGLVVVDYKTDRLSGTRAADVATRYRPQAAAYAVALRETLGRPVARCVFVFTRTPDADEVAISGDDLAAAIDELTLALAQRAGRSAPPAEPEQLSLL